MPENRLQTLTLTNMNQKLRNMEFPWPSSVVSLGNEMEALTRKGFQFHFGDVIHAHAGDPQGMGQKPITFFQQVSALCLNPDMMENNAFPPDVKARAQFILNNCIGNSVGSYSDSAGSEGVRKDVARFIERRDGVPSKYEDIFLSSGATDAVRIILSLINEGCGSQRAGVMIPCPQYPLFSATLMEYGMFQIDYYLDEDNHWSIDLAEMRRAVKEAKNHCRPRALVIISPGNPSGYVLSEEEIRDIIEFAYEEQLFILADEVYQYNVYAENQTFVSFKKVLFEMGPPYSRMELASFMSGSKGYMGECGCRSGYCEVINIDPLVKEKLWTILSAKLCPTLLGQAIMNCITNPPEPGDPSYQRFHKEKSAILESLKSRARFVYEQLNTMEGMECKKIPGAMYAYPRLFLPPKAIEEAQRLGQKPDEFYLIRMLENQGVCLIPGGLFGQKPGSYHFRLTFLPQMDKLSEIIRRIKNFHMEFMNVYK